MVHGQHNLKMPPKVDSTLHDMGEVMACICGITVAAVDCTTASSVAVQCGYLVGLGLLEENFDT